MECTPDTTKISYICSERAFGFLDPYSDEISVVALYLLNQNTPNKGYNYYAYSGKCYGHVACNGAVTQQDCFDCTYAAEDHLYNIYDTSLGAQIHLIDCRVRYEDYPFTN